MPGFRVQGQGFRVQGAGFRVQGLGFRVLGSGLFELLGGGRGGAGIAPAHPEPFKAPRNLAFSSEKTLHQNPKIILRKPQVPEAV